MEEYEREKDKQETDLDNLKERVLLLEKENRTLRMQRHDKKQAYEERVMDDMFNKPELNPNLAFQNFIQTAVKDFTLFENRLNEDFDKHFDKLKSSSTEFEIKPKIGAI